MNPSPSQITAIPENEIPEIFTSADDINEPTNFYKMHSVDIIKSNYSRPRIGSISGKTYVGMRNMRSYDNFHNSNDSNITRKKLAKIISSTGNSPSRKYSSKTVLSISMKKKK